MASNEQLYLLRVVALAHMDILCQCVPTVVSFSSELVKASLIK